MPSDEGLALRRLMQAFRLQANDFAGSANPSGSYKAIPDLSRLLM